MKTYTFNLKVHATGGLTKTYTGVKLQIIDCTGNVFVDSNGKWPGTIKVPKITDNYIVKFTKIPGKADFNANYGLMGDLSYPEFKPSIPECTLNSTKLEMISPISSTKYTTPG